MCVCMVSAPCIVLKSQVCVCVSGEHIYIYIYTYRVFTGNNGKVTYYISGSITHKFLKVLYLDYHSWTYITNNSQYHSRLFDIRNAS